MYNYRGQAPDAGMTDQEGRKIKRASQEPQTPEIPEAMSLYGNYEAAHKEILNKRKGVGGGTDV